MVKYEVSCDHQHCHYSQEVLLPEEVGDWEPAVESAIVGKDGEPVVKRWDGAPLEDAYAEHHAEHHQGQPPMLAWRVVE